MTTLTVEDLSVHYGGVRAAHDVSFTVGPGQSLGIIGANGAGKTSTLKAVMGLAPRQARIIRFGEHDLLHAPAHTLVRHGIGYVPEGRHVFSGLSVEKNLLLGAYTRSWKHAPINEVYELFPVLAEMRHRLAGALSGGQQQMLAVGRAMMCRPKVMLLDEPSMGLSPKLVGDIAGVLKKLNAAGLAILLVEQNAKLTFDVTTSCLVMENGEIAARGTSAELSNDPQVRRIYLGL
ncbi:ABC transporter ATP-binding protein [Nonomuraea sp. KC401]|uniref:ABC transporter ATP-binding protein n=1 Tax=unclassified Nonomuraea TaxID=2593643 RepID=UPI0010FD5614|nr:MULTISPECIES: ABC transporter ATP-binding protein [unclassified Nonomuraea]NBF00146.1 ATP-binding cassette domain-containing protein [Nonomuraea sp. K271]TLF53646.1 ABC transporter ATP-binding protein [Nonomuraea sp. KC401]